MLERNKTCTLRVTCKRELEGVERGKEEAEGAKPHGSIERLDNAPHFSIPIPICGRSEIISIAL